MTTATAQMRTAHDTPATPDDGCPGCERWELKFLVGVRVAGDLVPVLGRDKLGGVVEHVAATFARGLAAGGQPDGWDGFWIDYWRSVQASTDPAAADPDTERRRVWLDHAASMRHDPDPVDPPAGGEREATRVDPPVADLPDLDADDLDVDDQLGIARVRHLVSLVVLPYVSRHLHSLADLGTVVDDVTRQLHGAYEPGGPLDVDGFIRRYIASVEDATHGSDPPVDPARAWTEHTTAIRQRTRTR